MADEQTATIRNPYDGRVVGQVPVHDAAAVDAAVARARAALEAGELPDAGGGRHPRPRRRRLWPSRPRPSPHHLRGGGQAPQDGPRGGAAGGLHPHLLRRRGPRSRRRDGADGRLRGGRGKARLHPPGADRRDRRHLPVQLPAQPGGPQGRPGHRRRVPDRPEARRPDAAVGPGPPPAAGRGVRAPARLVPGRHRARLDRRAAARGASRHRHDHLHRLTRRGLVDPPAGAPQEGHPGAGQQRAGDHPRRRRLEAGRRRHQGGRFQPRRAVVHLHPADLRPPLHRRALRRGAGGRRRDAGHRRSHRPRHRRLLAHHARRDRPRAAAGSTRPSDPAPPSPPAGASTGPCTGRRC